MTRSVFLCLLHLLLPLTCLRAQQTTAPIAQAAQPDAQAIAILAQCLAASGGTTALSGIQDFTAAGTIHYNWSNQPVSGSVTVYGKRLNEFRMETSVSGGTTNVVVNEGGGESTNINGQKVSLPFYGVMTAGSLTFPLARIAAALGDHSTTIKYVGSVTKGGAQAYQLHVAPSIDPALTFGGTLVRLGEFDLFVDPTSNQLLALSEIVWPGNDTSQSCLHEIIFTNYTVVNGLSIPFGIVEKFGGQQTWSITLTSISFNSGLLDSSFDF